MLTRLFFIVVAVLIITGFILVVVHPGFAAVVALIPIIYVYFRAVLPLSKHPVAIAVYVTVFIIVTVCYSIGRFGAYGSATWYLLIGYTIFGTLLLLMLATLLADLIDLIIGTYRKAFPTVEFTSDPTEQRYKAIFIWIAYLVSSVIVLVLSYLPPEVVHQEITLPNLPQCMDGYKIMVMSDMHAGPILRRTRVEELVTQVNGLERNITALIGDLTDGTTSKISSYMAPLGTISGTVYYVPGNHEDYHGSSALEWMSYYQSIGITVLNNTRVTIGKTVSCAGFDLAGVEDHASGRENVAAALNGVDTSTSTVLLAHQPNTIRNVPRGSVALQISGHLHSGQFWPLHLLWFAPTDHFAGLEWNEAKQTSVYVSQGVFGWGPRTRFLSSNNIDIITLKRGSAQTDVGVGLYTIYAFLVVPFLVIIGLVLVTKLVLYLKGKLVPKPEPIYPYSSLIRIP